MVVLAWVGVVLAALYGWLVGNWFARVVVFIALAPVCGFLFAACIGDLAAPANDVGRDATVFGWPAGAFLAWWISSIPQRLLARREAITISPPIRPLTSQEVAEYAAIQKMPPNRHW